MGGGKVGREGRWGGKMRGVEGSLSVAYIQTYIQTYRHTDPLTKRVVEELSLLKN